MSKFSAWKRNSLCEGCSAKLSLFLKKKSCFFCKNYFCSVCIMRRPDGKMCCRKCQILTATPLDKNDLLNLRSRDLVNYLTSRHISTSGCVEKEDLVNILIAFSNSNASPHSVSNSGSNSYSNSPSRHSHTNVRPQSNRESAQSSDNFFNGDGVRIIGTDVVDEGSCSSSNHSSNTEGPDESDRVLSDNNDEATAVNPEEEEEENECQSNVVNGQSSTEPDVQTGDMNSKRERVNKPLKLSDISCSAELENLTIKELKTLLTANRTDFKGCVERAELIEKASRLWSDYISSRKDLEKLSFEELCKICMDAPIECVLLECGHMATCMCCGKQLSECPVCRQYVVRCVRTFKV